MFCNFYFYFCITVYAYFQVHHDWRTRASSPWIWHAWWQRHKGNPFWSWLWQCKQYISIPFSNKKQSKLITIKSIEKGYKHFFQNQYKALVSKDFSFLSFPSFQAKIMKNTHMQDTINCLNKYCINYKCLTFLQDGRINYDEFVAMMRKGNPEANPKKRRDVFVWFWCWFEEGKTEKEIIVNIPLVG